MNPNRQTSDHPDYYGVEIAKQGADPVDHKYRLTFVPADSAHALVADTSDDLERLVDLAQGKYRDMVPIIQKKIQNTMPTHLWTTL